MKKLFVLILSIFSMISMNLSAKQIQVFKGQNKIPTTKKINNGAATCLSK